MKRILLLIVFLLSQLFGQRKDTLIILSEVMFYNSTSIPNGEFIELFNTSYVDTIDINGWKIKYYTSPADVIVDAGFGTKLLPRQFAVIFEGDYAGGYTVPPEALILKINDNAFGTSGMANTSDRDVHLLNPANDTIGSYIYTANNAPGISDEKITLIGDNSPSNWSNSLIINGTPGAKNSVSPKEFDIGLLRVTLNPQFPVINDEVEVGVWIKNFGTNSASNFTVTFRFDYDNDGIFEKTFTSTPPISLNPNDTLFVKSDTVVKKLSNDVRIFIELNFPSDENKLNDTLSIIIKPGLTPGSILISEIMFDPRSGEPEWVELYNKSDVRINLRGWKLSDVLASPTLVTITNNDFYIEPKSLLVLAANLNIRNFYDSIPSPILVVSIPALNNDKDGVVIYDDRGLVIDSVFYFSDWGISKRSIERISFEQPSNMKSNWAPSIADSGGTPGQPNSTSNILPAKSMSLVINEIMYEPLTGYAEYVEIYNASEDTINLAGWKLIEGGGKYFTLSTRTFYLYPNQFFVVASDSSILRLYPQLMDELNSGRIRIVNSSDLSLSNSGDIVFIKDIFDNTIDSVAYSPNWHNPDVDNYKGRSLERINPSLNSNDGRNWSTSVNPLGGTPLSQNSVFIKKLPSTSKVEISPNPFSPDNDGYEDFTIISYQLPVATSQIRIRIFDSVGRLVRTLADNEPTASNGSIIFDGLDDNKQPLRIGIYILLIEAINQQQGIIEQIKKPIVVAKKLK